IQLIATAAISALLIFLSFILYRNLRQRKRLAKKERELYEQQMGDVMRQSEIRSLDSLMQGQEMERKRVAKDLHDRLGSMLSAIKLQFGALEGKVETVREENKQQYRHVTTLLDDAVGEVRRISHDMLKSSLAQFGLGGALDDLRQALSAPGKLDVEMTLFGLEERMEQKIEIAAFRMVQECVSNALKHAKATAITISVTRTTGALNVMVEDNGKGFDMSQVSEGMGLGNLRQRAAEVGGAVQFDSSPGYGTTVTIDVPLA
ncbi:MAG: sensor histidine kinase, partial [Flavobacteriales bacterium]|nr:sensor histidine kinase [Flavobacteriales bacterium]